CSRVLAPSEADVSSPTVPDPAALKSAARAAIVMPAVFAFADNVIQQPQTSIVAAFGSFALLVFVEFGGSQRARLVAYLALACVCAVMLIWPPRRRADLQREAARALRAVADLLDANRDEVAERARVAREAVDALGRRLLGSQHRPTGPTGPMAALASLPDELDWLLSFLSPPAEQAALALACAEDEGAMTSAAAVLRASADRLEGREVRPDFARLDAARDAVARALI